MRVIGENGKQIGILTKEKALEKAVKANLDLVEVAPKAKPPVVKIIDFGKFKYQEEKKLKKEKKKGKTSELKEIRFSPFIGEADYQMRLEKIFEFLEEKHKIKAVVKFKGRQMGSKKFGYGLFKRMLKDVGEGINIDMEPKFLGRHLIMIISPTSNRVIKKQNAKTKN